MIYFLFENLRLSYEGIRMMVINSILFKIRIFDHEEHLINNILVNKLKIVEFYF